MGEKSQLVGKELEEFCPALLKDFGWVLLGSDLSLDCTRTAHKSASSRSGRKLTHGIDKLFKFYNPAKSRDEAIIVECKNHKWHDFIPSQVNIWVEELVNSMECACDSAVINPLISETPLTTGLIIFNSSDHEYDKERAYRTLSQIEIPRRRVPFLLYIADTGRLEKWLAIETEIQKIKGSNPECNFEVIYPSIGGSTWDRTTVITPTYLFSDYVFATYIKTETDVNGTVKTDIKAIFCFDDGSEDSMMYLLDLIGKLQLEARWERQQEIHIYFYPETENDKTLIQGRFAQIVTPEKPKIKLLFLDNRRLSLIKP